MRPISTRKVDFTVRDIQAQEMAEELAFHMGIKKLVKKCKSARHLLAHMPTGEKTHARISEIYKKIFGGGK